MFPTIKFGDEQVLDLRTNKTLPSKVIDLPLGASVGLAPGTMVRCAVSYIQKTYSHVAPLATGDAKITLFGAGYDITNDVIDWPGSSGLLTETPMADVLGVRFRILAASYAAIPSISGATQTIVDAMNTLVNRSRFTAYKGIDVVQREQSRELLPTVGQFALATGNVAYAALEDVEKGSMAQQEAQRKLAMYFRAPIRIDRDSQFRIDWEGFGGYTVAAALNGYLLIGTAIVHEYPAELSSAIRAA